MRATNLRTEYLVNPIGISTKKPFLSWNAEGGKKQSAFRVVAKCDDTILLDSGRVNSSAMHYLWSSDPVKEKTKVDWSVTLWDENGVEGEEKSATFETGLDNFPSHWITGNYKVNKNVRYPVDCFKKVFNLNSVKKARLYITACGLYEARINGERVGSFILAPGITDYRKRVQYQTYDVTSLLKKGENTIEVYLADGWYRGSVGAWGIRNQYGTVTKINALLDIYNDKDEEVSIITDSSWAWSNDGPIVFADNKDGEIYDANKVPSFSGKAKKAKHSVVPTASNNVYVEEHEKFRGTLIKTPKGKTVINFGQNIAGYISFSINAHKGDKIKLRFGEILDKEGEFTQKNIQCSNKKKTTPLQEVIYTAKEGLNEYKPRFAIFGFQYVLVETDIPFKAEDFVAISVYSSMEETGKFDSSNPYLNKFVQNTIWSAKNNSCDLPTDCPTRERHGWTGDAEIFTPTASYLFNYMPFASKFLCDMYDWQTKDGCLPQIAPEGGTDFFMKTMNGSVGWADAGVFMPYTLWKMYGDKRILEKYLSGMRKYASFMIKRLGKFFILAEKTGLKHKDNKYISNSGQCYGEWAEPDEIHHMTWKDCAIPHPEVATAYTIRVLECMAEIEEVLGNKKESEEYLATASKCRKSYKKLRKTEKYSLNTSRQAELVRPLAFDLLDKEDKEYAQKRLIKALDDYSWRVGTGFLSTPLIMDVLSEIDLNAAYRLLENEKMPGWLFMSKKGASTVWEAWEGTESVNGGIASLDHYSKGAVVRWLFSAMCGIKVRGENHFVIEPLKGGNFTYANASYLSIFGLVKSGWKKEGDKTVYSIFIPANCTAEIILPNKESVSVESGEYIFEV